MPTLEVFTIGGGEYLVNVFNAVAAWCGGGGYRSLLQVVMVMGLAYSLCVVAFNLDWRAWMNWFIQSTLIYMMLMVPTVTVKVTDRIDPGLAPAAVDNVPLGLGVMASFTSQIGDWMTRTAETVFVMPNAVSLSNNGMIYGARLLEKARTFQITDAVFRANLDEQLKQCTFYDVLLGFKSMDDLTRSTNVWASIGPGSPARSQRWITSTGPGTTEASIIPCNEAYSRLDSQFNAQIEKDILPFSKSTYPKLIDTVAAQKLKDDLPIVAGHMHGSATDPYTYLKQVSTIDAFLAARESFSDAGWDAYASQRADAQAKNTYTSIAQQAMTWVPLLGIVLTVVFYAMFPVLFPLFLFPRTGVSTLKGYAVGFFYLASWGPLYVILHMFVMSRAASAYHAIAPNGPTLLVSDGIDSVNVDISTLAGFLMMSVPFLAAGMAKGAMAIAGQATSMLMPAQNAAEQAATERTTGNYSYGNTSFQNLTSGMVLLPGWEDVADREGFIRLVGRADAERRSHLGLLRRQPVPIAHPRLPLECRRGDRRRLNSEFVLQAFCRREGNLLGGRDRHCRACGRVAPLTLGTILHGELAEARNRDLFTLRGRVGDLIEHRRDRLLCVRLARAGRSRDTLGQLTDVHARSTPLIKAARP